MKKLVPILIIFILLIIIITRGGFITTNDPTTFYYKIENKTDSIISKNYYRDIKGNWILLDKGRVFNQKQVSKMQISNNDGKTHK